MMSLDGPIAGMTLWDHRLVWAVRQLAIRIGVIMLCARVEAAEPQSRWAAETV